MDQRMMQRAGSRVCAVRISWALVLVMLGMAALCACPLAGADGDYQLLKKVVLGGEGFWDYLNCDGAARRV